MSNWERDSQENNLIDWKIISCWWKGEKEVAASFHACKGLATVKTCHQAKDRMVSESKSQERKPRITKYLNCKDIRDTRELNWLAQGHTAVNGRVEPFIHMNDTHVLEFPSATHCACAGIASVESWVPASRGLKESLSLDSRPWAISCSGLILDWTHQSAKSRHTHTQC